VDSLDINDHGEVVIHLSGPPTEEFISGAQKYLRHPGSRSSAYDSRYFERFEGTSMVFKSMTVENFEKHFLPVALDAIKAGNQTATENYERRQAEVTEREKAKNAEQARIEEEKAKAAKIKFE
jgi:hypothetical protein